MRHNGWHLFASSFLPIVVKQYPIIKEVTSFQLSYSSSSSSAVILSSTRRRTRSSSFSFSSTRPLLLGRNNTNNNNNNNDASSSPQQQSTSSSSIMQSNIASVVEETSIIDNNRNDSNTVNRNESRNNIDIIKPRRMQACGICKGEGKMPSRKRQRQRKRRASQKKHNSTNRQSQPSSPSPSSLEETSTLQNGDSNDTSPPLPPPPPPMHPCKKCGGSGILPFLPPTTNNRNHNDTTNTNTKKQQWNPTVNPTTHIGIIGGGIGGLALAIACQHRNIPYTLFERDAHIEERKEGYGLTMQQGGQALKALGLQSSGTSTTTTTTDSTTAAAAQEKVQSEERLFGRGIHSTRHIVHTANGTQVGEWGMRKWGRPESKKHTDSKRQNVHVARQELRRLLYHHLEGNKDEHIRWGHKLLHYQTNDGVEGEGEGEGSITLTLEVRKASTTTNTSTTHTITTQTVTTLVGADGIRSAVRPHKIGHTVSPPSATCTAS